MGGFSPGTLAHTAGGLFLLLLFRPLPIFSPVLGPPSLLIHFLSPSSFSPPQPQLHSINHHFSLSTADPPVYQRVIAFLQSYKSARLIFSISSRSFVTFFPVASLPGCPGNSSRLRRSLKLATQKITPHRKKISSWKKKLELGMYIEFFFFSPDSIAWDCFFQSSPVECPTPITFTPTTQNPTPRSHLPLSALTTTDIFLCLRGSSKPAFEIKKR